MCEFYDTAQICLNGHAINHAYHLYPEHNQDFCDKCGELTIFKCQNCETEIKGVYNVKGVIGYRPDKAPNFCHKCGKPYPWTVKKLDAIREIADELEELSTEEKEKLKNSLDDIIVETPKSEVAGLRFKKILGKLGRDSYESIKSILVDIASETIKKSLFEE